MKFYTILFSVLFSLRSCDYYLSEESMFYRFFFIFCWVVAPLSFIIYKVYKNLDFSELISFWRKLLVEWREFLVILNFRKEETSLNLISDISNEDELKNSKKNNTELLLTINNRFFKPTMDYLKNIDMKKVKMIFWGVLVLLVITNPSAPSFSNYIEGSYDRNHVKTYRKYNFFVCSVYTYERTDYLGILTNFIEL